MHDPRNATSSWSGYLHQGKVGIFVALKKIVELIEGKNDKEIEEILKKWRIIYENAEDFDIQEIHTNGVIEDNGEKWRVDSRHQVKAYKDGVNLNNYKDVLNIQKCIAQEKKEKGKKIKKTKKTYEKIIEIKGFQIRTFYVDKTTGSCTEGDIEVDENNRFLHTIKNVQGFGLSENDFNTKKVNGEILNNPDFRPNPNNIKLYPYPDGNYCDITSSNDKMKEWCNEEIKKIKGSETIDDIYEKLLYLLDEEIRNKHTGGGFPIFSFYDLYNEIGSFITFEEYDEMRLRESFAKYYEYYKLDMLMPYNEVNMNILEEYMNKISSLNKDDFYLYLKDIHFYEDFFFNGKDFNKNGFGSVVCDFIYDIKGITKIDDLHNILDCNNFKLSCCNEESRRSYKVIRGLIENIDNGKLNVNLFSGKKIMNRNIDMDIEPFTTMKNSILEDENWGMLISNKSKIGELARSSLITTKTILDNINK